LPRNNIFLLKKINESNFTFKFSFSFISLITPTSFVDFNSLLYPLTDNKKKVFLKQSYIILTWFYYLSFLEKKKNKKKNKKKIQFITLPQKKKFFTLTKAPMAHKNWSKEQFELKFYCFKYIYVTNFTNDSSIIFVNNALHFSLLTKIFFPKFETNLFFLKNFIIFYYFNDKYFYSYYNTIYNN
jgi:hypothetical protein